MHTDPAPAIKVVPAGREDRLTRLVLRATPGLFPGYFALVMATRIVSIACYRLGQGWIALPLVVISWCGCVVLWVLTLMRLMRYLRRLIVDLSNHQRAPGFFTMVAGNACWALKV